jgi:hypothetical protein
MKKTKNTTNSTTDVLELVNETPITEQVNVTITNPVVEQVKKQRGRPIIADSNRQKRILDLQMRRENGTLKLGRPKMTPEQKAKSEALKAQFKMFLESQGK